MPGGLTLGFAMHLVILTIKAIYKVQDRLIAKVQLMSATELSIV